MANFERNKGGERFDFHGIDLVHPVDLLPPGRCPYAQNLRRYLKGGIIGRNLLTAPVSVINQQTVAINSGTVAQSGSGAAWTTPSNLISPSATASVTINSSLNTVSEFLTLTNLGISIPVGQTILGIQFSCSIAGNHYWQAVSASVSCLQNGVAVGSPVTVAPTGTSLVPITVGGPSSLFGYGWTPALVNGATGLGFSVRASTSIPYISSLEINNLVVTVYYGAGSPLTFSVPPHTIKRLNDSTPAGPPAGYALVSGAGQNVYLNGNEIASGMSGNPLSVVPFRPNASVQPWAYIGDDSESAQIDTQSLYSGNPTTFSCFGEVKVRSDGLIYKTGVMEPQLAPEVGTNNTSVVISASLQATAIPWTNYNGANSGYDYGETNGYPNPISPDGTAPFVIDCQNATSVTFSITGSATVNGGTATPTTLGPSTSVSTNPGHYVQEEGSGTTPPPTASVIIGAFTDGAGNVVGMGSAPTFVSSVIDIGGTLGSAIPVPYNAVALQVGINSTGNTFSANSGTFALQATVTTDALPPNLATLGNLTAYYWGDSPVSGPVGVYIWKNPGDSSGSGPARETSSSVGSTTGNSFIFDANFGSSAVPTQAAGIPGPPGLDMYSTNPGDTTVPMQWTNLSPQSVNIGATPVFQPSLKGVDGNTAYQNFNFCLTGTIYVPQAGQYTFVLTYKDDILWGIGGGATVVSSSAQRLEYSSGNPPTLSSTAAVGTSRSDAGQTMTVASGLPLLPRAIVNYNNHGEGGVESKATVVVNFPSAGTFPIEVDYDFWYHSGRILLIQASATPDGAPTIIPPLPANVRQDVQYRYVYRSSATGAESNPSPESTAISLPVTSSTVTSIWSPDPQIDVVDYYRLDSVTSNFTYVATGPNDNSGSGTNTPIVDSLTDTELGDQLLEYDNFEPFPSIDLPQKGICSVSGGVITWVSGGAIGGSSTGFNTRWLAGTTILIGSPTSLAYVFIARPTSNTSVTIPGVPNGDNLAYEIPEPILANQPLPYLFGPTDNINFTFGVGDPLRPGTLYWCKGSNLDSAPDTNQEDVTDPGEPLVNGAMSGGRGVLFSIKRAWVIMPNFFNALATATGTTGSQWTLQATSINRGLFMPWCVAIEGGGLIFFRVNDGIHISPGGLGSKSITDEDLYPLFPHENEDGSTSVPQPVTLAGYTIYPPDDTKPQNQKFKVVGAYLYYNYIGTDGNNHTLAYDIAAEGWVPDVYQWPATVHADNDDTSTTGTYVGCNDGSVRQFATGPSAIEVATAVYLTPSIDFGDTRATKQIGDLYMESTNP